jgi:hypothetical protein
LKPTSFAKHRRRHCTCVKKRGVQGCGWVQAGAGGPAPPTPPSAPHPRHIQATCTCTPPPEWPLPRAIPAPFVQEPLDTVDGELQLFSTFKTTGKAYKFNCV